jgi:selenide,water dikinase
LKRDENLLVGTETSDDAAVYKINEKEALVVTMDFFTPVVDDPYQYGQIAAANALSDVFAMGGEAKLAMNIACVPSGLHAAMVGDILKGMRDKVEEAGAFVVGGHTIEDLEPKFGLSVTGFVHPNRVWTNSGAQVGDVLFLTKPLGMGVLSTAIKADLISPEGMETAVSIMSELNLYAKRIAEDFTIHACTDVTGFGLAGHGLEMAEGSGLTLLLEGETLPFVAEAIEWAEMGILPAGMYSNRGHVGKKIAVEANLSEAQQDLIFDPQTSGGLLLAVAEGEADELEVSFAKAGRFCVRIGRAVEKREVSLLIR